MPLITKDCEWCGATFEAKSWEVNRGRGRYCSVSCKSAYGRSLQDTHGDKNPGWKGGVRQENMLAQAAAWNRANPHKRRAHHAVEHALKMGRLVREPCSICGATSNVDAHHHDYDQPLNVEWMCRSCHIKEHRVA